MKSYRHWPVLLVIIYSAWAAGPAAAHALLVRSNPAANAVLAQPPVQVEIFFSEPLEEQLSSIRVFDSNSVPVDAEDVRVDPSDLTRLTVTLHSLPAGVYTVTWKVVSSIDGHQTTGSFPFAVGNENAAAVSAIEQRSSFRLPVSTLISKFLMLVSLALLLGHWLFGALIWEPVAGRNNPEVARPPLIWARFYRLGLIGLLLSIGLGMLAQGGQSTGRELALPWDIELGRMLTETRLGGIWLARVALAILAVWLTAKRESPLRDWASFAAGLTLLLTVTLTSHAATEPRPFFPMLADWLHLGGMTFWLGGVTYFYTAVRHLQSLPGGMPTRLTSLLASRFSVTAVGVVGLIGLTGLYSAYLRVGAWEGLVTSLYGHTLLVKQVFVAGLLAIAATNLLVVSPQLKRDREHGVANPGIVRRFGKLLIFELAFAGLLLGSVSFLTYIPPAKLAAPDSGLKAAARVEDLKLDLSISPGRIGQNTFVLRLLSGGKPLRSVREVVLRFTPDRENIAPSELELISQGDGTYSARGTYLSVPGTWQVQAIVRREDRFDAYANFNFVLQSPGAATGATAAFSRQTGLLLLLTGGLSGLLLARGQVIPALRLGAGAPLSVVLIGLGLFFLLRPAPAGAARINPIPPGAASVATGQDIFRTNCAPCHGQTGRGDGPVGVTLNPRPADLSQHAVVGIHSDAQLFEWITNGFPGSRMPAFKSTLSDTERWHLVNFIRSLAPK